MPLSSVTTSARERETLDAARAGDENAYRALVEPFRGELHAHCYRMLGSLQDAEDALQEALLRAWRGLARFEGRSSLRSWLYRIATNTCLNAIERRPKRVLPIDYGPPSDSADALAEPLSESVWIEPYPDEELGVEDGYAAPEARYEQRESVELAFVAALQHLPPRQRAVLVLRDVLGFSAGEVADALDSTTASVYSALQRAHEAVEERLPERSQQATMRSLDDAELRGLTGRFVEAWENADVDSLLSMLTDEAVIAMPPRPTWFRGHEAIRFFLREWPLASAGRWRLVPASVGGQLAFGSYGLDPESGRWVFHGLEVLTVEGPKIAEITAFLDPELAPRFGLPAQLTD